MGYTAKELAENIEVRAESVSRWENDKDLMSPSNEKLLRLIVGEMLAEVAPALDFEAGKIVRMRIQSARAIEDTRPICLARVAVKLPKQPKSPHWSILDEAA